MNHFIRLLVFIAVAAVGSPAVAQFGSLEPGKRITGHAKLDCTKCHTEGSGISDTKCLSCHEHRDLKNRIRANKGLHARKDFKKGCEQCHAEHQGRKYNPIDWSPIGGKKKFKHKLTGYELEGAHRRVDCKECHTAKYKKSSRTKYLGLKTNCLECHEDIHHFRKTNKSLLDCEVCHTYDARTVGRARGLPFDHGKISKFPLRAKHNETKCTNCHSSIKSFKIPEKPERCVDCHEDTHRNVYTTKKRDCKACHSDRLVKFDKKVPNWNHKKRTGFALDGKHGKISCTSCHKKTSTKAPNNSCLTCHTDDSAHIVGGKDRFKGRNCAQCHSSASFKKQVPFNHGKNTGFSLGGKHGSLKCFDCHRKKESRKRAKKPEDTFEFFKSSKCVGCHAHKNDHDGKFNTRPHLCRKCHVPGSTNIKNPDHRELSPTFAQQGAHNAVACDTCHGDSLSNLNPGKDCSACHKDDDAHAGNLGSECSQCHVEGFPWTEVLFEHDLQSDFKLEGKHTAVPCTRCHTAAPKTYKPTSQRCVDCHGQQDVHKAKLGTDCASCHDANGRTVRFDHNNMTDYPLEGSHARADCTGCHFEGDPADAKIDLSFDVLGEHCSDCHGDPHGLRPDSACLGCHTLEDWGDAAGGFGSGDIAPAKVKKNKNSKKTSTIPDPNGSKIEQEMFSGAQHEKDGPTGFLAWFVGTEKPRDPYHDNPPFNLRDGHDRMDCVRCHAGRGDMQGMGKMCDTCHKSDDIHAGALGPQCGNCHRQRAFTPAYFSHTQTGFSLVGVHRLLSCKQCHSAGNYQGISGDCVGCHLDDATRAVATSTIDHLAAGGRGTQSCIACHNQVTWMTTLVRRRF